MRAELPANTSGFSFSGNYTDPDNSHINLALNKPAASSSNYDGSQTAGKAFDGNPATDWQATGGLLANEWLRADLGAGATFDSVRLSEYGNRTGSFRIEYSDDATTWHTAYTGTTIGAGASFTFAPVTGRYVRIYFLTGTPSPIIYEFEVYDNANIASAASPVASGTDYANGYSPLKANDGNTGSFEGWAGAAPGTLDFDWRESKTFDSVVVFTTSGYVLTDYDLQAWNGSSFTTVASVRSNTLTVIQSAFSAVTTIALRVNCISGDMYSIARIDEIRVYLRNSGNHATAAASCTDTTGNWYSASKAIDGNTSDFDGWSCGTTSWFELTWPTAKTFDRVDLYTTTGYYLQNYDLQIWNGSYSTIVSITGNSNKLVSSTFTAVTSNKLRVYCTVGDMYNIARIDEIQVFNSGTDVTQDQGQPKLTRPTSEEEQATVSGKPVLNIYPNPSNSHAFITWQGISDRQITLNVYDISGRLIKTFSANGNANQYDLYSSDLKSGMYYIQLSSSKTTLMQKLIIAH